MEYAKAGDTTYQGFYFSENLTDDVVPYLNIFQIFIIQIINTVACESRYAARSWDVY